MRRYLSSTAIVLIITAAGFSGVATSDRDADQYAAYSLLLNQITKSPEDGSPVKLFVINDRTSVDRQTGYSPRYVFRMYKLALSPAFQAALKDYETKNKQPQTLTRSFNLKSDYLLLESKDFDAFFNDTNVRDNWRSFYRKYPNSPGYITVSRVGFDSTGTHALLYFEIKCGGLCADGSYQLLTKENGAWKVTKEISFWAS